MRILFVDDEPRILNGLRRMLLESDGDWDAEFVTGGHEALECLAQHPFDVVVSDMRMPRMDGAELLQRVQKLYPNVVRIVLTGQSDEPSAVKALRVAHQFLMKPFDSELFLKVIERTHGIQRLLTNHALREAIGQIDLLPPVPKLYHELSDMLTNSEVDVRRVAGIIERDVGVSAKILQLANSAFFAPRTAVSDVRSAVSHLGMNVIKNLVLGVELFEIGMNHSPAVMRFTERLQAQSFQMAGLCSILSKGTALHHDAFTVGLLLDSGQLAFAMVNDRWLPLEEQSRSSSQLLCENERSEYGASHADVGAFLLGIWGLPFAVVEAVATHHDNTSFFGASLSMTSIAAAAVALQEHVDLDESMLEKCGILAGYLDARRQMSAGSQQAR